MESGSDKWTPEGEVKRLSLSIFRRKTRVILGQECVGILLEVGIAISCVNQGGTAD